MVNLLSPSDIIQTGGLLLVGLIVFAEVGLLLGFILPGDTLLIAAGVYAHEGKIALIPVIAITIFAAITGDSLSYYWGRKLGPAVFKKDDSVLFNTSHVARAEKFYAKYGAKALLITHFLPVVRAFMPMLAGVAKMPYRRFLVFNIAGDILWAVSVTLVGYYIGSRIPGVDKYILLLVFAAVFFSAAPTLYHYIRMRLKSRAANQAQ
jgi:membrane-associated protein